MAASATTVRLPISAVSKADVVMLLRELELLNEHMSQAAIGSNGDKLVMPRVSVMLRQLAQINGYDIESSSDRAKLVVFLGRVKESAPTLHMTFPSEPSPEAVEEVVSWLRDEVHTYALLHVGVQPALVAGCMLRTTNKVFDFSLRKRIQDSRDILREKIGALSAQAN